MPGKLATGAVQYDSGPQHLWYEQEAPEGEMLKHLHTGG